MSFIDQPGFADDVRSVLLDLLNLPPRFMDYTVQYNAVNPLPIPISQITGFTQFVGNYASVGTQEATTSTTLTNLATVGPQLTELPNGKYLVMIGCLAEDAGGNGAIISINVNGTNFPDQGETQASFFTSIIGVSEQTLNSGNNNTITMKYRSNAGTSCTFLNRWLFALKIANL